MPRGEAFDEDTRSSVMQALLAGQGVNEVARKYNISKAAVSRLKTQVSAEQLEQLEQVGTVAGSSIEPLVTEYLSAALGALTTQARVASDESYLRRYSPQQLALLHGIMADKTARIIEALSGASRREEGEEATDGGESEETEQSGGVGSA